MSEKFQTFALKTSTACMFLFGIACSLSHATVIAVDSAVPATMNAGGTSANLAQYIIGDSGAYSKSFGSVYTGSSTSFNELLIRNGSTMQSGAGYVGQAATSNNNSVIITGTGSKWTSSSNIEVGTQGSNNTIRVESRGLLSMQDLVVGGGYDNIGTRGGNNTVVVTGTGSNITSAGSITVGSFASNNQLLIENGGTLNTTSIQVGVGDSVPPVNNNAVKVTGAGSKATIANQISIGGIGTGNSLIIENGAVVVCQNPNSTSSVGVGSKSSGNSMIIRGVGSSFTGSLYIGNHTSGNVLTIEDGGKVISESALIGFSASANNNRVVVDKSGSSWTLSAELQVGQGGSGNSLSITDGGSVVTPTAVVGNGGGNNFAEIRGENSVWRNRYQFTLGSSSSDNFINIADQGMLVVDGDFWVDLNSGTNNCLRIDGGFFALKGNRINEMASLLYYGDILAWNGTDWVSGWDNENVKYSFYSTAEEALAFTGYEGLAGYTILTAVPEPGIFGMIGLSLVAFGLWVATKRRERA